MKRKIILVSVLLWLASLLAALDVYGPQAQLIQMPLNELRQAKLVSFETRRDKDGAIQSETWEGIPLLAWLLSNVSTEWQNLKVQSKDSYQVNFSRMELSDSNFYLALRQNGRELSDYDIRIIHIPSRESAWIRNLDSIKLETFLPYPQPQQIYILENWLSKHKIASLALADLLPEFFSLENCDLIFIDDQGYKLRMNYPRDLAKAKFVIGEGGELRLDFGKNLPIGLATEKSLEEIVYFQAGALALVKQSKLTALAEVAKELGWNWDGKKVYIVKGKRKALSGLGSARKNLSDGCLELR